MGRGWGCGVGGVGSLLTKKHQLIPYFFGYKLGFPSIDRPEIFKISLAYFCYKMWRLFQNTPENLDPSYKMDLDL